MALNFPNNPAGGQLHTDPSNGLEYVYNSTKNSWSMTGGDTTTTAGIPIAPPGPNPPANPVEGTLWYNTDSGILYTYYVDTDSSQWVNIQALSE